MAQRHVHDNVERLWEGAADPADSRYVPIPLRDLVADCPAEVEAKLVRELYTTNSMVRSVGNRIVEVHPSTDPDGLELALIWKKCSWAATKLDGDKAAADRAAHDDLLYRCEICGEVRTPTLTGSHTQRRVLANGRSVKACNECAAVAEQLAVAELAAQTIDGRTRGELVADVLAKDTT